VRIAGEETTAVVQASERFGDQEDRENAQGDEERCLKQQAPERPEASFGRVPEGRH
jgi:hypothetical protein